MEDLQTVLDTVTDYGKNQNPGNPDFSKESENDCGENLLNGSDELDPLGLMDQCDESIGSNSDVWKGSDSEDDSFEKEKAQTSQIENVAEEKLRETPVPTEQNEEKGETEAPETVQNVIESEGTDSAELPKDQEEAEKEQETEKLDCKTDDPLSSKDHEEETIEKLDCKTGDTEVSKDQEEEKIEKLDCKTGDTDVSKDQVEEKIEKLDCKTGDTDVSKDQEEAENDKTGNVDENSKDQAEVENEPENEKLDSSTDITATKSPEVPVGTEKANEEEKESLAPQTSENQPESSQGPLAEPTQNSSKDTTPNCVAVDQDEDCHMDYDAEDDDDFDPSLLCPEVSMDVDENRVITNNGTVPNESGSGSPLPYEPLFSAFVDDVTGAEIEFNLTPEELELKKRLYGATNPIQYTRIHCTACNVHLGSALEGQNNRFVHPLLKVLICKECYHFYTSGEFEKDEDGSELYCRWCGQGGQVLCCSKCEFVFCKRCIRTNFGRKKMFEIRDSDSWECFRCNSSQIITQRIACYEFFEYIRREMAWTANANNQELWSKDYSRCCGGDKKRSAVGEEKKTKRKKSSDPDYNPFVDYSKMSEPKTDPLAFGGNKVTLPKLVQIVPKVNSVGDKTKDNDIEFVRQIPAPHVTINPTNRPAYRTILPAVRPGLQPSTYVRLNPASPLAPTTNRFVSTAINNRNLMKHEWFEKTVRAAARVNSHLSYTLTQLNKAQSQAGSVEELAVVHNKLQEILSSSINSLIQIRKNLRTEFIAGIKTVHLPSKKPEQSDDDVIIVSPPAVMPKPAPCPTKTAIDPLIIIEKPKTNSTKTVTTGPQKGFLKVKSVSELQNIPPECITIPDDPPTVSEKACNGGSPKVKTYKVADKSVDVKKMMAVRVNLIRDDLEKLQRQMKKDS
ncbi:uncharacterized protein ADD1 isoform X1 [Tribolium castaneum]|uniref:uncharacterized protein ADD1 isoform X1 n=1 Tax=Tribolium castaneum TaxID=7070 RepID=UPI0030FE8430